MTLGSSEKWQVNVVGNSRQKKSRSFLDEGENPRAGCSTICKDFI